MSFFGKRLDINLDKRVQNTHFLMYCLSNGTFGLVSLHSVFSSLYFFSVCSKCYYSMLVRLIVIRTIEKQTSECRLSKETNTMHIIQMVQEQHAIYFGYALF